MTEIEPAPNRGSLTFEDVERIRNLYNGYKGAFGTILHFVSHPGKLHDAMRLETHRAFTDNRINARSTVEDINQILHEYVRANANAEEFILRRTRAIQILSLGTVGVWGGLVAGVSSTALGLIPLVDIAAKLSIGSGLATVPTLLLSDRAAVLRSRRLQRPQPVPAAP
jgi:hypothetical protein